ncbi:hypothetical protein BD626DRAFT_521228 [Schizophyllum amplum]|uniref:Ser-Thr-rich glycosyl-phosphatidyl-inositol-anchored membrane family-domain-containing protein n=1 Tax=Schizophyllum amplum TaxID=97359 RepID=A0A550BTS5_9AGAR|nr:hypothetical protein BD626DRAFT_521228 [Auriculariopsis ampla]
MFTSVKTLTLALPLAALLAGVARADDSDFRVIVPGGDDLWWVAQSTNNIIWTCEDSPYSNFSVYLSNTDVNILSGPIGIIAVQENYDCSKMITQQQAAQPAGKGYKVLLTDTLNSTHVYAESEEFEIKALGATYPDASATPTGQATDTAAAASATVSSSSGSGGDGGSSSEGNGAATLYGSVVGVVMTGVIGVLTAGLMGVMGVLV